MKKRRIMGHLGLGDNSGRCAKYIVASDCAADDHPVQPQRSVRVVVIEGEVHESMFASVRDEDRRETARCWASSPVDVGAAVAAYVRR